jgi:hypothetical protein
VGSGRKEEQSMAMEDERGAVGLIMTFPGVTEEQYYAVLEQLDLGGRMPHGDISHAAAPYGFAAFLTERQGRLTGYLLPGNFGHGVAETEEDALALITEAARHLPAEFARFFCPLSEGNFYRKALQRGCRMIKVMNYMTLGPYEHPDEVWMPSVLY